jgi:hypothetical protein
MHARSQQRRLVQRPNFPYKFEAASSENDGSYAGVSG